MKPANILLISTAMMAAAGCAPRTAVKAMPSVPTIVADVCAQCHGATGTSTSADIPNLAGQHAEYLVRQLRAFRDHSRSDALGAQNMWKASHHLDDPQIDATAAYYATRTPLRQPVLGTPAQIAAGEKIFFGAAQKQGVPPCSGCHGSDGVGKTLFPRLAGQHMRYLVTQLTVFQRSEQRPDGAVMMSVSHALGDEDIANAAAFLQSLPGGAVAQ
jgi:cytochrome c553